MESESSKLFSSLFSELSFFQFSTSTSALRVPSTFFPEEAFDLDLSRILSLYKQRCRPAGFDSREQGMCVTDRRVFRATHFLRGEIPVYDEKKQKKNLDLLHHNRPLQQLHLLAVVICRRDFGSATLLVENE